MASDAGIYALAGKPTIALQDPNTVMQNAATTANSVLANKLAQAQQVRGALMQQAIDPQTGQYSPAKFNQLAAQDPRVAAAMPEAVQQSQGLMANQNDLATKQNAYMSSALGAVLKLPDSQLHYGAASAMNEAVAQGLIKPEDAIRQSMQLSNDPAQLRQQLTQAQMRIMSPGAQRDATYGTPGTLNTGGAAQSGVVAPVDSATPGAFQPTASQSMTMSPGDVNAPVKIGTDAQGRDIMGTKGQFVRRATASDAGAGGNSSLGDGRFPDALRNPNRQPAPNAAPVAGGGGQGGTPAPGLAPAPAAPAPIPNAAPGGGLAMGVGPAQQAALTERGAASAKGFQDIADQGVQARGQSATLGTMLADTQNFDSGETFWNNLKTKLMRQTPGTAALMGIKPEQIASLESFDKFANQLASAQGSGSDARLSVAQNANPSSKMSKEGVDLVLRQLQGNADYQQARARLAAQHPDQADRAGFEASTGAQLDPRAFQVARMTTAQRQVYDKSLSPTDRAQVRASYNFAHNAGLFTAPSPTPVAPPAAANPTAPKVIISPQQPSTAATGTTPRGY
jgi:hypothetical protein